MLWDFLGYFFIVNRQNFLKAWTHTFIHFFSRDSIYLVFFSRGTLNAKKWDPIYRTLTIKCPVSDCRVLLIYNSVKWSGDCKTSVPIYSINCVVNVRSHIICTKVSIGIFFQIVLKDDLTWSHIGKKFPTSTIAFAGLQFFMRLYMYIHYNSTWVLISECRVISLYSALNKTFET